MMRYNKIKVTIKTYNATTSYGPIDNNHPNKLQLNHFINQRNITK